MTVDRPSFDKPIIVRRNVEDSVRFPPHQNHRTMDRDLMQILGSLNVASKHWIIRQYDHEVQGGSVLKPLVGVENDGPGDAAVVRPVLESRRGLAIACGMNPHFGDLDPYHMAASSIDEAIRNCVAVGADPNRIAILDNFCWGHTDRPSNFGNIGPCRAGLPRSFDRVQDAIHQRQRQSAQRIQLHRSFRSSPDDFDSSNVADQCFGPSPGRHAKCVSMDCKTAGNLMYQIGSTGNHLGGSHWSLVNQASGRHSASQVDATTGKTDF